jgi:hypothetical protein
LSQTPDFGGLVVVKHDVTSIATLWLPEEAGAAQVSRVNFVEIVVKKRGSTDSLVG